MMSSNSRQFVFDYKVVNSALIVTICWSLEVRSLSTLAKKRGVRKFPQSFFLVEIGSPNNK